MKQIGSRVLVLAASAAVLASCSGGTPVAQPVGSTGGTTSTHATTSKAGRATTTGAAPRVTPTTTAPAAAAGGNLAGIGATAASFRAVHGEDVNSVNCPIIDPCYGPIVLNVESGTTYQFTDVVFHGGLVVAYGQNFPTNTSVGAAEAYVLRFFPLDAKMGPVTIDNHGGNCALYNITSPTVGAAFAARPGSGSTSGVVGVELSYTNAAAKITFDPKNVEDAFVSLGPVMPNGPC